MSITLKRPMFRKGGEVMEGIMTGIKPRKMFALGTDDQTIVDDVRRRMNLIDIVAGGGSPISDPLTQFLLQTGQNLIGGTAAGGTKLQEIVGATRDPLNKAIAAQTRRDLGRRKLAATLLSKSDSTTIDKINRNARALAKARNIPFSQAFDIEFNKVYYKDPPSPRAIEDKEIALEAKSIMDRNTDYQGKSLFGFDTTRDMAKAKRDLLKSEQFKKNKEKFKLDSSQYYLPADVKLTDGKKPGSKIPSDTEDLEVNNIYYNYKDGIWYLYDGVTLSPRFNRPKEG